MKKKLAVLFLATLLIISLSVSSYAAASIFIDLEEVKTDTAPQIINSRTMVPARAITEMIGYDVKWISETQSVEVYEKGSSTASIFMQINNPTATYIKFDIELGDYVSFETPLDSPPVIYNNRTLVPLRFISEAIGYEVDYNVDSANVYMFSPEYMQNQVGEGIGEDVGEGIGVTVNLTEKEKNYILSLRTKSWTDLTESRASYVCDLIARWFDSEGGFVIENFEEFEQMLGAQMGQYWRTETDMGVFETACELMGQKIENYVDIKG